jgi:imidazoleglycerol-phosphate dehydratase/histidinol-phosphatase
MLDVLHSQGVKFFDIHIDCTTDEENAPTRKPRTGMLHKYLNNPDMFDIQNSFVIGDRRTDVQLAKNLGCQSILIENDLHLDYNNTITSEEEEYIALKVRDWKVISQFLLSAGITRTSKRVTNETTIAITVRNPGIGKYSIETGLPFFNHMLEQLAKHSGLDISIEATGDLDIEAHHLIEDVGIVLGEILNSSLGSKIGIERYGFSLPMDESSANVQIDVGGRPSFRFEGTFSRSEINGFPTEMVTHFFESLAMNAKWNVHISVTGENDHHKIESVFKAFAKSIAMSLKKTNSTSVASTKGLLL